MKKAIASLGKDKNSEISQVAGRAPYYLIFEGKKLVKTISNPFRQGGGGAGFGVAKMLANENVGEAVAGKFGGNMVSAMNENKIKTKTAKGKVSDIL